MSDRLAEGYTARALAALGLPGLRRPRHVQMRAKAERWPYEERTTRGGTCRWYPAAGLPAELRRAIEERPRTPEERVETPPEAHLRIAQERLELTARVEAEIVRGAKLGDALALVAAESSASERTLRRWWDSVRELPRTEWLEALRPTWRAGGKVAECHAEAWTYFRSDYLRAEKPGYRAVYGRTVALAQARGWQPVPSLDALKARLEREVPFETRVLLREGRDALGRLYPAQQRDRTTLRALEAVNADGHRFDVRVQWPDGKIERPIMVAFQDLRSSKILGWRIDRTENADVVRLAFGDVVERFGVPEHAYLDNGRAFASKDITGGARWRFRFKVCQGECQGVMLAVGVQEIHWTIPYHGQSKPIERAFGELCESISKHPICAGAYTGRNTGSKPHNYESRAVPLADFIEHVAARIAEHNARPDREGANVRGRSFNSVFAESYAQGPVQRASEAQRRMLLLAAEQVTVRQGTACVHLLGNRYWHPALGPLQGTKVTLRYDPARLHDAPVHVYRADGSYLCAADCQAAVGFADRGAAREHARKRSDWLKAEKARAEALAQLSDRELIELHTGARHPERVPAPKVIKPLFDAPKSEPPREHAPAIDLVAEIGRAAMSSGRIQPRRRRASND